MDRAELVQDIVENLTRCQRPAFNSNWKKIGLSHAQMSMLFMLLYHPQASSKEIASCLGTTKSAISQVIEPLEQKRLISRQPDLKDRRIVRLRLTAKGKKVLHEVHKLKFAGLRSRLDSLSTKELSQLAQIYKKMASNTPDIKTKEV